MARILKKNNKILIANSKAISVKNYQYKDGQIDESGLADIGWNEESILSLRDNAPHYAWQDSDYQVSQANKALYGVVTKDNISTYKTNADLIFCPYFDTTGKVSMSAMFHQAEQLKGVPKLNTSSVTNMEYMFNNCKSIQTIPKFDTSSVTNMDRMFYVCYNLQSIPLLDTSNVTNMGSMFANCSNLVNLTFKEGSSINVTLSLAQSTKLSYDSIKSILTAASNTINTNAKTLSLNRTMSDPEGELDTLVTACTNRGWTISGLTLTA